MNFLCGTGVLAQDHLRGRFTTQTALAALTLFGLTLRLIVAFSVNHYFPDDRSRLVGDEFGYDYLASSLLQGDFFQWPGRTPAYPLFLALCYWAFGHSYAAVVYVQAFVSALTIPLTFLLARFFTSTKGALISAALIAVNGPLILQVTRLYSEVLYTVLLLMFVLTFLKALKEPLPLRFGVAGGLLGLANLCRPTAALFPVVIPFLMPASWSRSRKIVLAAVCAGAMLIVIAPWTYHNYRTYRVFLPLSVSTAMLWQGSPEFYRLMEEKRTLVEIWNEQLNPARNGGHDPFSIEGDRYFIARAFASIQAEPAVYSRYFLQKLVFFWFGNPAADWPAYAIYNLRELQLTVATLSVPKMIAIVTSRLLPLFTVIAVFVLRRDLRRFAPMLAICGYFMFFHAITYAEIRYSQPLQPILATIIGTATAKIVWKRTD